MDIKDLFGNELSEVVNQKLKEAGKRIELVDHEYKDVEEMTDSEYIKYRENQKESR